ncbi:MAG: sigma-70 family RNA polymerase sigma factor, partial [Chloroflexi bacterium]|nr:sigma-70 family RNA polymerase sigma factor [Chloroflexota bacterium]
TFEKKLIADNTAPLRDAATFQALYQRTHLIVYRYIFGMYNGSAQDVEDLTADAFVRAWKARRRFRGSPDAAAGWLLRIARNLVIDSFRRHQRDGYTLELDEHIISSPQASPEERALQKEKINKLYGALDKLTTQQREIIVLRYLLDWQVKAIASYMGMKENTVSVNIRRALHRVRREWE